MILESGDGLYALGMNREEYSLQGCFFEYIERYDLEDGTSIYKILVLHDNECSTTYFTQVGIHDPETEEWLKSQVEWSERR